LFLLGAVVVSLRDSSAAPYDDIEANVPDRNGVAADRLVAQLVCVIERRSGFFFDFFFFFFFQQLADESARAREEGGDVRDESQAPHIPIATRDEAAEIRIRMRNEFDSKAPFDWSVSLPTRRLVRRDMTADEPDAVLQCTVCRRLAARVLETALRGAPIDARALCAAALPEASAALGAMREVCDVLVRQLDQQLPASVLQRRADGVGRDAAMRRAVTAAGASADDLLGEHVAAALALCNTPLNLCRRRDAAPRLTFANAIEGDHVDGFVHYAGRRASLFVLNELLAESVADGVRERDARRLRESDTAGLAPPPPDEYPPILHVVWLHDPLQPYTAAHYAALLSAIQAFQPARTYLYFDTMPQDANAKVNKWFTRATQHVEFVRVSPVRFVGDMAVRHVAHAAKLVGLLALRAVGGTLIDNDCLMLRDFSPARNASMADFGRDVTLLRVPPSALQKSALPRVDLSIIRAQRYARWLGRLIEEVSANYNTMAWDAHFVAAASALVELYPSEVRVVDVRSFDFGVEPLTGAPTDAFWQLLETTGEQLDGVTTVRLRQEQVVELGMSLPDWETLPGARPDVMTSLLCELRPYKGELAELETFWHTARWALRSGRFATAAGFLERYLHDAEPELMKNHVHDEKMMVYDGFSDGDTLDADDAAAGGGGGGATPQPSRAQRNATTRPPKVLPSALLAARPDRERAWARIMLAYSYAFRGLAHEAALHASEATVHHGRTMREVWFHAARIYRIVSAQPEAQLIGADGERRVALSSMRTVGDMWDIADCFRDARAWRRDQN
jgi:hypothetical protein